MLRYVLPILVYPQILQTLSLPSNQIHFSAFSFIKLSLNHSGLRNHAQHLSLHLLNYDDSNKELCHRHICALNCVKHIIQVDIEKKGTKY